MKTNPKIKLPSNDSTMKEVKNRTIENIGMYCIHHFGINDEWISPLVPRIRLVSLFVVVLPPTTIAYGFIRAFLTYVFSIFIHRYWKTIDDDICFQNNHSLPFEDEECLNTYAHPNHLDFFVFPTLFFSVVLPIFFSLRVYPFSF